MDVYWLEQNKADLPERNDWLSASDTARLTSMRFEKRREDWRLGRWTAKRSVAAFLRLPLELDALAEIEIRPAPSGAPEVFLANQPAHVSLSLSHSAGSAICAVAQPRVALGCDLELIEARSDAFVSDYFTTEEQGLVAQAHRSNRAQLLALLWSGKESALKALGVGLTIDTRSVVVDPMPFLPANQDKDQSGNDPSLESWQLYGADEWRPFRVRYGVDIFQGWWQHAHDFLRTMVAAPAPSQPIPLVIPE